MIPVLTIDGPSAVGKGTVATIVASQLSWNLLDSGAIYRVSVLAVSNGNVLVDTLDYLLTLASTLDL